MEVENPVNKLLNNAGETSGSVVRFPLCNLGTNFDHAGNAHKSAQFIPRMSTAISFQKKHIFKINMDTYKESTDWNRPCFYYFLK